MIVKKFFGEAEKWVDTNSGVPKGRGQESPGASLWGTEMDLIWKIKDQPFGTYLSEIMEKFKNVNEMCISPYKAL